MDGIVGPLVGVVGAIGGVPIGYVLSGARAQTEWRAQKRAETVSELYRLLPRVQVTASSATFPVVPLQVRRQRVEQNKQALHDMTYYLHGHALWVDARTLPTIVAFVDGLSSALKHYEAELDKGTPDSTLALRAAGHVQRIVPEAEMVLEQEFRAIVYPKTWREYLADSLERFERRNRRPAGDGSVPLDSERKA